MSELLPADPAALANQDALASFYNPRGLDPSHEDSDMLRRLDAVAENLDFIENPYWVNATRGFSIPAEFESSEEVSIIKYDQLAFSGVFVCYAKVVIGRIMGTEERDIEALCLTFNEPTIIPTFETIRDDDLLYVPVLSVNEIDALPEAA